MSEEESVEQITDVMVHEAAVEASPIAKIETSLSDFLQHSFQIVNDNDSFQKAIQAEVLSRLSRLNDGQLLALLTNSQTNLNDLASKLIAPTMTLATAKQQAELAARRDSQANPTYSQTNIHELNASTPQSVLVGLKSLTDLLEILNKGKLSLPAE
jgi:hypothetical protein